MAQSYDDDGSRRNEIRQQATTATAANRKQKTALTALKYDALNKSRETERAREQKQKIKPKILS